ncbi:hypothetical protein ACFU44_10805 [Nocardia rhizosphaerihabitans]|uniref:hypothetical protein n=1 Tax=Nocardia rhizosphaerihabitans TaxID=1691570 RepID=UPI00366C28E3
MLRAGIPVHVDKDTTLRVKVGGACGLTFTFCHDEGAPVAVDNRASLRCLLVLWVPERETSWLLRRCIAPQEVA